MVCCGAVDSEGKERDKEINSVLKNSRNNEKRKIKLLLLGAGESGKSTIFKQMKILYGTPATRDEREQYSAVIYNNTIMTIKNLVAQAAIFELQNQV
jgi:GTPase SAR1 family protein